MTLARTKLTVFSHIVLWVPATTRWQQSSFIKSEGVTEQLWQCNQQEQVDGGTGAAEGVVHSSYTGRSCSRCHRRRLMSRLAWFMRATYRHANNECCQTGKTLQVQKAEIISVNLEQDRQWEEELSWCQILWNTHEMIKLQARHCDHMLHPCSIINCVASDLHWFEWFTGLAF